MCTTKDYVAVANIIAEQRGTIGNHIPTLDKLQRELADYFAAQNPAFKRALFDKVCTEKP